MKKSSYGIAGQLATHLHQFEADAGHRRRGPGSGFPGRTRHPARGGAADPRPHARRDDRHAGCLAAGSRTARHHPVEKPDARNSRRRDVYSISSPGQSLVIVRFLVGTSPGRRVDQGLQQALLQRRSHAPGRLAAAHQGPVHRRRSHLGAHPVGEHYNGYQLRQMADEVEHLSARSPTFPRQR